MQKLYAALQEMFPGHEVADVRFLADQSDDAAPSVDELDVAFASAVAGATDFDWSSLSN